MTDNAQPLNLKPETRKQYKRKKNEALPVMTPTLFSNHETSEGTTLKVYHADCLSFLKSQEDASVSLIVMDPPYNVLRDARAKWDNFRPDVYLQFMSEVLKECSRILKPTGQLYLWHNDFDQVAQLLTLEKGALEYGGLIIWDKVSTRAQSWKNIKDSNPLRTWFNTSEFCMHFIQNKESDGTGWKEVLHNPQNFQRNRQYSARILDFIKMTPGQLIKRHGGCVAHFFVIHAQQYGMCVESTYDMLTQVYNLKDMEGYLSYAELRQMYEDDKKAQRALAEQNAKPRYTFNTGLYPEYNNVWRTSEKQNNGKLHPTQKPLDLHEKIIRTSSHAGDLVLDCFMGSGTTAVACATTGRNFIGCELSEEYCQVSSDRIAEAIKSGKKAQSFSTMAMPKTFNNFQD